MKALKKIFNLIEYLLLIFLAVLIIFKLYIYFHLSYMDDSDFACEWNKQILRGNVRSFIIKNSQSLNISSLKFMNLSEKPENVKYAGKQYLCPKSKNEYSIQCNNTNEIIIICPYHGKEPFLIEKFDIELQKYYNPWKNKTLNTGN